MDFTVIICTYNRAGNLSTCIEKLARQTDVGSIEWEVLIVDNNSSDATRETVGQLASVGYPKIRYAFESEQGLNYARNRGVRDSAGKYFCFIDDDILVGPHWLHSVYDALKRNDADALGGRIHLDPSLTLPKWIQPDMYGFLGYQDFGDKPFQMDGIKRYPFGGNMAFNRRVVEKIGYFNPKLGRKGAGRKRGELFKGAETDFSHRLTAAGGRIFYEPRAIVYHQILPFQLRKKYFRTIHYNAGYQKAYFDGSEFRRKLFGIPLFMFVHLARAVGRYLFHVATKGPDFAFRQRMTVGYTLGMINGYARRPSK